MATRRSPVPPPPADPPAWLHRSPLGRALLRLGDADRPRQLAGRRIGRAVIAAAPLRVRRPGGPRARPEHVLLALTDETVYVLWFRDQRPFGARVGGVLEALPRGELVAHWSPRLGGRLRAELSWPDHGRFLC